jgi:hypothetical protein
LYFAEGVPIFLLGCKKDLRNDPATIGELLKTSEYPVSPDQVRIAISNFIWIIHLQLSVALRANMSGRKLVLLNI